MDIFKLIIIFLFSLYNLYLYFSGNIANYISERFFSFSLAGSLIGVTLSLVGIIYIIVTTKNKRELWDSIAPLITLSSVIGLGIVINPLFILISIPLFIYLKKDIKFQLDLGILILIVVVLGFSVPSVSLTSITASQRSGDFNSVNLESRLSTISRFANTANYDIGDWIASINYNPDLNFYANKEVEITGFIFDLEKSDSQNVFMAARFVVTCCAVDARPVGLKVRFNNWANTFNPDDWVKVKGKFAIEEINGQNQLVVMAENVLSTEEPDRPYIY